MNCKQNICSQSRVDGCGAGFKIDGCPIHTCHRISVAVDGSHVFFWQRPHPHLLVTDYRLLIGYLQCPICIYIYIYIYTQIFLCWALGTSPCEREERRDGYRVFIKWGCSRRGCSGWGKYYIINQCITSYRSPHPVSTAPPFDES